MTGTALAYREDAEVVEASTEANALVEQARALVVMDEPTNNEALVMLADCRQFVKRLEAKRKEYVDPLNAQVKYINADFQNMESAAKEADSILSRKTSEYRMKVAEAARKEQERLRVLAEKRQAAAAAKAEAKGLEAPPVMPLVPTVAAPAKTVETDSGAKITYRKQFHFEIVNAALLPREYLLPDEPKIRKVASAGIEIPGVRVWYTEEATVR